MFEVIIGKAGLHNSHQAPFPETTQCCRCNGTSRIGFTVCEMPEHPGDEKKCLSEDFVCNLHQNFPHAIDDENGYWLHDCVAVAVYFCKDCLETTALYNQA